ncbi:uncharacterized protein BcabD6B2_54420 [Babesia caballi]|uniref:Exoribonuclease phosphorolytic domain-containing protein n=1 Tax=Babesia caballi TaxID=5871 RepID=A0AAV4M1N9_BABCB|nr:hypothetical protein BcabD6B2_54420 [Babesia caballi]
MSKIEYISLEGLRVDGRRPGEVRNIEILCGRECGVDVINYDGIAQVTHGLTKAQAYVNGPTDVGRNKQRPTADAANAGVEIQCEVVMPSEKRATGNKMNHQTSNIAQAVITTFERIIVAHLYKNSTIHIFVNVLEADGGVKATVINAVLVALVDAGIAMRDLIVASTAAMLNSQLLIGNENLREVHGGRDDERAACVRAAGLQVDRGGLRGQVAPQPARLCGIHSLHAPHPGVLLPVDRPQGAALPEEALRSIAVGRRCVGQQRRQACRLALLRKALLLGVIQRFLDHLVQVLRNASGVYEALQLTQHQRAERRVQLLELGQVNGLVGRNVRVYRVHGQNLVGEELVAGARGVVEAHTARERANERVGAVRVGVGEVLVGGEGLHTLQAVGRVADGLGTEPLVDDEGVAVSALVKVSHDGILLGEVHVHQLDEGAVAVGHVASGAVVLQSKLDGPGVAGGDQVGEKRVAQVATSHVLLLKSVHVGAERLVSLRELSLAVVENGPTDAAHGRPQLVGVVGLELRNQCLSVGQHDAERLLVVVVARSQHGLDRVEDGVADGGLAAEVRKNDLGAHALRSLPAVQAVGVMRHQKQEVLVTLVEFHLDWGGEAAVEREHAVLVNALKGEGLVLLTELHHEGALEVTLGRLAQQADLDRDVERELGVLARGGGSALAQAQTEGGAVAESLDDLHLGSAGLEIPPLELGEVYVVRVGHGGAEVVAGHGLHVVALEVEVHALAEALLAKQRLVHANDLGALVVDGGGVEVVHRNVALGANGVRHGPGVLGELVGDEVAHVSDAAEQVGGHVAGELGLAEDSQALLESQLEPVAAGDAVASPVVEVLVADHAHDGDELGVGGGVDVGQQQRRVEDVEALVLHGAEVESASADHVELVQVVLATVGLLVPLHGLQHALVGPLELSGVLGLGGNLDQDVASAHGAEGAADGLQVRRLGEGVNELRKVLGAVDAAVDLVAVGQEHGVELLVRAHAHPEAAEHVGAVQEEGDAAEPVRLALGGEEVAVLVQAGELQVGGRVNHDLGVDLELLAGGGGQKRLGDGQVAILVDAVAGQRAALELLAVDGDLPAVELVAVEHEVGGSGALLAVHQQLGLDNGRGLVEVEVEEHALNVVDGGLVVLAEYLHVLLRRLQGEALHGLDGSRRRSGGCGGHFAKVQVTVRCRAKCRVTAAVHETER